MRNLLYIPALALTVLTLHSCSTGSNGELIGVKQKPWFEPTPYGMQIIPTGSFIMGPNDQDAKAAFNSQNNQISIDAFWIDETEITNSEYKQFVSWTRDSLARLFIFKNQVGTDANKFAQQDKTGTIQFLDEPNNIPRLNYKAKFDRRDPDVMLVLDTLFNYSFSPLMGKQLKNSAFIYTFYWIDYKQAALKTNQINPLTNRYDRQITPAVIAPEDSAAFMIRKDISVIKDDGTFDNLTVFKPLTDRNDFNMQRTVNIYPDTLCWLRDFTYAYNDAYLQYFNHPGYGDYPLVGISWDQAVAFCHWRTKMKNNFLIEKGEAVVQDYRLPSESEWEYAARGGRTAGAMYPWGGPYTRKADGCFLANFKPQRGNNPADGFLTTSKIASYPPNDYGLYDMAGNVAEWTSSTYSESSMSFSGDMNPTYQINARIKDPAIMKRKVVRGGSWKDIAYFLQCGVSTYEYQEESRSFIGFRCVRSFIGPE